MTATVELVAAVREFLAGLTLEGRDAFHAKVAANALAIVERELAGGAAAMEATALARFTSSPRRTPGLGSAVAGLDASGGVAGSEEPSPGFCRGDGGEKDGRSTDEATLMSRATICAAIRMGTLTAATPGLLDALIAATCARLAIDNPRYPTLARLSSDAAARR